MEPESEDFNNFLPAVWLIFGGSYFNHSNAPKTTPRAQDDNVKSSNKQEPSDCREQILVDLLRYHIENEYVNHLQSSALITQLMSVVELFKIWSEDLTLIYEIRVLSNNNDVEFDSKLKFLAERIFQRISDFHECTIIPTGLISSELTDGNENVSLAILKEEGHRMDWIQVDPGSTYHQCCHDLVDTRRNAFFNVRNVQKSKITREWVRLLLTFKCITPTQCYKELMFYEWLLPHLNGESTLQSKPDEGFIRYRHSSPTHTWQVLDQSFRYLLQHFLGNSYLPIYQEITTSFKISLMEKSLTIYEEKVSKDIRQCHFLLQEMMRDVAQQALDHGNEKQKEHAFVVCEAVKVALDNSCSKQQLELELQSNIGDVHVSSCRFPALHLPKITSSSNTSSSSSLDIHPNFVKPNMQDDIIDYLKKFRGNFLNKLTAEDFDTSALICRSIEECFINFLWKSDILEVTGLLPFTRNDVYLASCLKDLGELYYTCQGRLVNCYLKKETYEPLLYAKNVVVQFFVYAAIAALNLRHGRIGPVLANYNLSTSCSESLKLSTIIPSLVIEDSQWLNVLFSVQTFFEHSIERHTLFSFRSFINKKPAFNMTLSIRNESELMDNNVRFAYDLLQTDADVFDAFNDDHADLEPVEAHRKWTKLTYTDPKKYLPELYTFLPLVAHSAKTALTGFDLLNTGSKKYSAEWFCSKKYGSYSLVNFRVNTRCVSTNAEVSKLTSYRLKTNSASVNSFQPFISFNWEKDDKNAKKSIHLCENEIIARLNQKPDTMDCNRYLHLGFLQSEPHLKLERLYIALKEQQLNFSSKEEGVLIKQTLFEISISKEIDEVPCTLLKWTAFHKPELIHELGSLLIEKARAMKYCLTQHYALGDILIVTLGLVTFYPSEYRDFFIEGILDIFYMLKGILTESPTHLSDQTLLYLNAYLIIIVQASQHLLKTEIVTILKAFLEIERYKAIGTHLDNNFLLRIRSASFDWYSQVEDRLHEDSDILNNVMLNINPQWNQESSWTKSKNELLFRCNDFAIRPLHGCVYFNNQSIRGLPSSIKEHQVFRDYIGEVNFAVRPETCEIDSKMLPCYVSVGYEPQTRFTLVQNKILLIEEWIQDSFQRYVPAHEISSHENKYPQAFYKLPNNTGKLRHWLKGRSLILIKDENKKVVFEWDLKARTLLSVQHGGYVVPWKQLKTCFFKKWLEQMELPDWIELIARPTSNGSGYYIIESLNLPRLGLHFCYQKGEFFSKQIHGYVIAKLQHLNTLHGSSYMVLERKERNSTCVSKKIIIPHRIIKPTGPFYNKIPIIDATDVLSPAYFVYDYDPKLNMLKGHHIRAQLYLALLFYCSVSMDNLDISNCNLYHLARENLELCWKDEPYDEVEFSIIEQFFNLSDLRDARSHSLALYLKVASLLICSLRLEFLYTDESAEVIKKKSHQLLTSMSKQLPRLFLSYLQNKPNIFVRIQLSSEEEEDILKQCLQPTSNIKNNREEVAEILSFLRAYNQVYFKLQPQSLSPPNALRPFNSFYRQFFSQKTLLDTEFENIFQNHLAFFKFPFTAETIWWTKKLSSSSISCILSDQFHLKNFISLYNLARSSQVSLSKYSYFLHYIVLMASITHSEFPSEVRMMLARALLLVAENPDLFPKSPQWFNANHLSVNLTLRKVYKSDIIDSIPSLHWKRPRDYDEFDDEKKEKELQKFEEEKQKYEEENKRIWKLFSQYDLDDEGVPLSLPSNKDDFQLEYESRMTFLYLSKKEIVRDVHRRAAYNDSMFNFFYHIVKVCDDEKYASEMAWPVAAPSIDKKINVHFEAKKENALAIASQQVSLERWIVPQQPLVDLNQFFTFTLSQAEESGFLFESQLREQKNGYQHKFYSELKDSWSAYQTEDRCTYSWLSSQSLSELEFVLRSKFEIIRERTEQLWGHIVERFKLRTNSESNNYFALRWHCGQVLYYNKQDLLTVLIAPQKVELYNPDCVAQKEVVYQELLEYLIHEINSAKLMRVLNLLENHKEADNDTERFSIVQTLVRSLQENLNSESYRNPHWILFQFENEIIVRNNQSELILAMLAQNGKAMFQLNMGEGKSSVILPLLSYNLADGNQLLRINVLSALLITMKEFLRQRFSGLIRKRIYTLPFNRDMDISTKNITLISNMLKTCQNNRHILLVTPEHRLCLQLKTRELLLEHQQQMEATNLFNWNTYRQRAEFKDDVYKDLTETEKEDRLLKQDKCLKACLQADGYIDTEDSDTNKILKAPPRGRGRLEFANYKKRIDDSSFREWSCLKAAYQELNCNSKLAFADTSEKLKLLSEMNVLRAIDLFDESDEILKHGTELNYTIGDRCAFAGGELRWKIPQFFIKAIFCDFEIREVIDAGKVHGFTAVSQRFSDEGGVPFIQLLCKSYFDDHIKPSLVEKFFQENLSSLRKFQTSADSCFAQDGISSLRQYVAGKLQLNEEKKVLAFLADKGPLKDKLLIAKGWLSHGILFHVFNSKYRVQFGLHLNSEGEAIKRIAIPFLGKDTPSPRSEFSHPDVMLGFTIISYLYKGLSQKELKETLLNLKGSFSAPVGDMTLSSWTQAGEDWISTQVDEFPPLQLKSLQYMDLADELCLTQAHQYLSGNHLAIFDYLNQFVLLEEATQYRHKISANAHSLVGYNAALGFSGTDDRKITMPFQVESRCSTSQIGTNGKLLSVLTEERNSHYQSLETEDSKKLLTELCLFVKENKSCHALIDAGALVTGLSNSDVAKFLITHLPDTFVGILYFSDEGNKLTVQTRDGKISALQDCYLDKRFLFAYLDDIHTRGTDIQLPLNCHAILTIGMDMSKDKLMQAAMRLRQLAQKQSVSLWGTQAVSFAIARDNSVDPTKINSLEVIKWVTRNTINHINEDLFPVAVRKINFEFLLRAEAWLKEAPANLNILVQFCQSEELFQLEEFYALSPQCEDLADRLDWLVATRIRIFWRDLALEFQNKKLTDTPFYKKMFERSNKVNLKDQLSRISEEMTEYLQEGLIHQSLEDDEEKEVEVEIIQERRVLFKLEHQKARQEQLWDVQIILLDDFITEAQEAAIIMPLCSIKHYVQHPACIEEITWHKDIYMTSNYIKSIIREKEGTLDNYLRPVDVVLIHRSPDKSEALLLSGREASRIKSRCFDNFGNNLLVHINDINGHTQWPSDSVVTKQEHKLLTIIKLFAGECHYASKREVQRIAKLVGRIYPQFFNCLNLDRTNSEELYDVLIQGDYLDFAGVMTENFLKILRSVRRGEPLFEFPEDIELNKNLSKKVFALFQDLIIRSSTSLQSGHYVLWQWVGARNRLREYPGSALESVINSEHKIKFTY
ncbi:uncharacterized protein [Bemisia tabaci]